MQCFSCGFNGFIFEGTARGVNKLRLMMLAISMTMAISVTMTISVMSVVSSLAYLSGRLVWDVLAYLFWNGCTFFNWYFEWDLSGYWVAYLSWFVMTGGWSWNNLGYIDAVSFWYWYAFWYLNLSWDLDWDISAYAFYFDSACWWAYSNWSSTSKDRSTYSKWSWSNNRSGTKTRQKKGFSVSCFRVGVSF